MPTSTQAFYSRTYRPNLPPNCSFKIGAEKAYSVATSTGFGKNK